MGHEFLKQNDIADHKSSASQNVAEAGELLPSHAVELECDLFVARSASPLGTESDKVPGVQTQSCSKEDEESTQNQSVLVEDVRDRYRTCAQTDDDQVEHATINGAWLDLLLDYPDGRGGHPGHPLGRR